MWTWNKNRMFYTQKKTEMNILHSPGKTTSYIPLYLSALWHRHDTHMFTLTTDVITHKLWPTCVAATVTTVSLLPQYIIGLLTFMDYSGPYACETNEKLIIVDIIVRLFSSFFLWKSRFLPPVSVSTKMYVSLDIYSWFICGLTMVL